MYSLSKQVNSLNSESSLVPRFLENGMWTHIIMNLFLLSGCGQREHNTDTIYRVRKEQNGESKEFGIRGSWGWISTLTLTTRGTLGRSLNVSEP